MKIHPGTISKIVRDAKAKTGGDYRFIFGSEGPFDCSAYHWERRNPYSPSKQVVIAHGTFDECWAALADYVEAYVPPSPYGPRVMVDGDLNLVPARNPAPMAAE